MSRIKIYANQSKFSEEEFEEVKTLKSQGMTLKDLADFFNTTGDILRIYLNGKCKWKEVKYVDGDEFKKYYTDGASEFAMMKKFNLTQYQFRRVQRELGLYEYKYSQSKGCMFKKEAYSTDELDYGKLFKCPWSYRHIPEYGYGQLTIKEYLNQTP